MSGRFAFASLSALIGIAATSIGSGGASAASPREWRFIASGSDIRVTVHDIPKPQKNKETGAHDLFIVTQHGKKPLGHLRFTNVPASAHMLMPAGEQPSDTIFLLRKAGIPDERALVVTSKGVIHDFPISEAYAVKKLHLLLLITSDKKHETTSLTVLDLSTGKIELEIKNASRPREFLETGKHYRPWLSDSEMLIEPTDSAPGTSWLRISIDGKQLEHVPPPEAESRSFLTSVPRLHWSKLRAPSDS